MAGIILREVAADEECREQVGNALEELAGKEVKVSSDPTCSRILEALVPSMDAEHLLAFISPCAGADEFCTLSSRSVHHTLYEGY
jgi:hypothetical protein